MSLWKLPGCKPQSQVFSRSGPFRSCPNSCYNSDSLETSLIKYHQLGSVRAFLFLDFLMTINHKHYIEVMTIKKAKKRADIKLKKLQSLLVEIRVSYYFMRGSRKINRGGSNFDNVFLLFFLIDEGREDPNTTISGPSFARQRNAI